MTRNLPAHVPGRGWGALLLAAALLVGGASTALADAPTSNRAAGPDKRKPSTVVVVVNDMKMEGMHEHEHPPGSMSMTVTPGSVRAGKVKFTVSNTGTELHEMVVLKTSTAFDQLPVNAKHKINESSAVGEVPSIAAGKHKSKILKLERGTYALVCNITDHYEAGMRAAFTVT